PPSLRPVLELTTCRPIPDSPHCHGRRRARVQSGIALRRCHNLLLVHSISRLKRHRLARLLPPRTSSPGGIGHRGGPGSLPGSANAALLPDSAKPPARANSALPTQIRRRADSDRPPFCTSRRLGHSPIGQVFDLRKCHPTRPALMRCP